MDFANKLATNVMNVGKGNPMDPNFFNDVVSFRDRVSTILAGMEISWKALMHEASSDEEKKLSKMTFEALYGVYKRSFTRGTRIKLVTTGLGGISWRNYPLLPVDAEKLALQSGK